MLGVGAVLWVGGLILYVGHDHPGGFIDDHAFVQTANTACTVAIANMPPAAGEDATFEERATAVEAGHAALTALVDELASIAVDEQDRPEVAWWIGRWRQFLSVGPEYATAIRTGEREIYTVIGNMGDDAARDINEFALNNAIEACRV